MLLFPSLQAALTMLLFPSLHFSSLAPSYPVPPPPPVPLVVFCLPHITPVGMIVLHGLEALITPPPRYPDLYPALFSLHGACNLIVVYILGVTWQWSLD